MTKESISTLIEELRAARGGPSVGPGEPTGSSAFRAMEPCKLVPMKETSQMFEAGHTADPSDYPDGQIARSQYSWERKLAAAPELKLP